MPLQIDVLIDSTVTASVDGDELARAARQAALSRGFDQGQIGIRVTDDSTIHQVNRQHLQHDYPTDVISFAYLAQSPEIEGELIISCDTAHRRAAELAWEAANEMLLYVVHGVLHLTGMDDGQSEPRRQMRHAEAVIMAELGIADFDRFGADAQPTGDSLSDQPKGGKVSPNAVTEQQT